MNTPIEIAGAGPAGLAAAITLAKAGQKVLIHETHNEVGYRFAGDFQGLDNWTSPKDVLDVFTEQGITTDFIARPCLNGTVFGPTGKRYPIKSKEVLFYLVERGPGPGTLDSAMLEQACSLGVEVRFNSRLKKISDRGIMAAGPRAADAIAVGYHFETNQKDGYWAICDNKLAPYGYAYLLILNGRGTVKTCMFAEFNQQKQYLKKTIAAFEHLVGLDMQNPVFHGGSGNFYVPRTAYRGSHPIIGEQAGFQDTLWGFGMRLAISSGVLAAQSLIMNKNYDKLWQKNLKPQMDVSVVNRAIFHLISYHSFDWFLRLVSTRKNLRQTLHSQYHPSLLKHLLSPWAKKHYKSNRKQTTCDQTNCHCTWCRAEYCVQESLENGT